MKNKNLFYSRIFKLTENRPLPEKLHVSSSKKDYLVKTKEKLRLSKEQERIRHWQT